MGQTRINPNSENRPLLRHKILTCLTNNAGDFDTPSTIVHPPFVPVFEREFGVRIRALLLHMRLEITSGLMFEYL